MKTIKLVIASDIHDDVEALNYVAEYSACQEVDAILLAGDLSLRPYNTQDLEQLLASKTEDGFPESALQKFVQAKNDHNFQVLSSMKAILGRSGVPFYVIGGNYDPLLSPIFGNKDLHTSTTKLGTIKMAGYGGADEYPPHIILLAQLGQIVPYSSDDLYEFLSKEMPDICLVHNPPEGICDATYNGSHAGDSKFRRFIAKHSPKLVISGHIHESGPNSNNPLGIAGLGIYINGSTEKVTVAVNPGNLGRYDAVSFPSLETEMSFDHGTFMRVDMDQDGTPFLVRSFSIQPVDERGKKEILQRTLDPCTKLAEYDLTRINYNAITPGSVFHPPNQWN